MPRHMLTKLALREVSLCSDPINPEATVLLFKSKDPKENDDMPKTLEEQLAEANAKISALSTELEQSKTDAASKAKDAETALTTEKSAREAAEAKVADLSKSNETLTTELDNIKKSGADEVLTIGGKEIRKSKVGADVFDAMKLQQEAIEKARSDAELVEFTKSAETTYKNLPGEPAKKGAALRAIGKLDKEVRDTIEAALKAGDAAMAEQLKGRGGTEDPNQPTTALGKLNKAAADIQKAKPALTSAEAFDEALTANPDLYAQYEAEKRKAA